MTRNLPLSLALLTVLFTVAFPAATPALAQAQERFDAVEHGFSIALPEGWRSFPASQLRHLNGQASSTEERASEFLAIVEDEHGGKITIRVYPAFEDEDTRTETRKVAFEPQDTTRPEPLTPVGTLEAMDLVYGKPHWDEEDEVLWTAFLTGRMRALEVRKPYSEGVIRLSWIGISEAELVAAHGILEEMLESMRFEDRVEVARRR